ncbi:MAG: GNAT family N-acetyltransferase [Jatrophihabitans sp.]
MLSPVYPIATDRLLLRPLDRMRDVDAVLAYQSRPEVMRNLRVAPRSREEVVEFLTSPATRSTFELPGHMISLAVVVRETDELIGDASLVWSSAVHERAEFGCVLHPEFQGHGYATEACTALVRYAFEGLGVHRVIARLDERNRASAAMVQRIGLRREACLVDHEKVDGHWITELVFAVLADEWAAG